MRWVRGVGIFVVTFHGHGGRRGNTFVMGSNSYQVVFWGKMPIKFSPRDFDREEVEIAVAYVTRSFPRVLDLVPDFSSLAVGKDANRDKMAVLKLGDETEARVLRRAAAREMGLRGLLCVIATSIRARERGIRRDRIWM